MVALIMFIHGVLYWFREAEDNEEAPVAHHDGLEVNPLHDRSRQASIELSFDNATQTHRRSTIGGNNVPAINNNAAGGTIRLAAKRGSITFGSSGRGTIAVPHRRLDWPGIKERILEWWGDLVFTRKLDVIFIPLLFVIYIVGLAIILGRPTKAADLQLVSQK
jgi:hypothetical protein